MGFFFGIYDPDTIHSALKHFDKTTAWPAASGAGTTYDAVQLKQDWGQLAAKFSWRLQPTGAPKVFGTIY